MSSYAWSDLASCDHRCDMIIVMMGYSSIAGRLRYRICIINQWISNIDIAHQIRYSILSISIFIYYCNINTSLYQYTTMGAAFRSLLNVFSSKKLEVSLPIGLFVSLLPTFVEYVNNPLFPCVKRWEKPWLLLRLLPLQLLLCSYHYLLGFREFL